MLHLLALVVGVAVGLLVYNVVLEKEKREMRLIGSVVGALVAAWLAQSLMDKQPQNGPTNGGPPSAIPPPVIAGGGATVQIQNNTNFGLQYQKMSTAAPQGYDLNSGVYSNSLPSIIPTIPSTSMVTLSDQPFHTVISFWSAGVIGGPGGPSQADAMLVLDPSGNMVKTITGNLQVGNPSPGVYSVTPFAGAVVGTRTS